MIAVYNANGAAPDVSGGNDARPLEVWIAFLVPSGSHLKQLTFNGKPVAQMEQVVPCNACAHAGRMGETE